MCAPTDLYAVLDWCTIEVTDFPGLFYMFAVGVAACHVFAIKHEIDTDGMAGYVVQGDIQ